MPETPPVTRDTRRHSRYEVSIPVDCSTRQYFFSNHVSNISRGGLFIRSDRPLPLEAEVSLTLKLPGIERSIYASGRVVWNYDIEKGTAHIAPGSGIKFVGMTAADRAVLEGYLAGLTPAASWPPTRH
jgi:type IV pilus assembly protein PilZ